MRFLHLFPGLVRTPALEQHWLPVRLVMQAAGALLGRTIADYAHVPFYLVANAEGQRLVGTEPMATHWNEKGARIAPSSALQNPETRRRIWEFLLRQLGQ